MTNFGGADQRGNLGGADQRGRFRLQIVSITAIFVAIGAGLLLGSLPRDRPAAAANGDQIAALSRGNEALQSQVDELKRRTSTDAGFAEALAPQLLATRLHGLNVLTLATPSGVDSVDDVSRMLRTAGATVSGSLQLTDRYSDSAHRDELLALSRSALPSTVVSLPAGADGAAASASVLSTVLLKRTPPLSEQDVFAVLASYAGAGYVRGTDVAPADAVVVVSGPADANQPTLILTTYLSRAGQVVVAGDTGAGNLVGQVRLDPALSTSVSTVDDIDLPIGQLVVAWAVADQIAGRTGHYGTGQGTTLMPKIS